MCKDGEKLDESRVSGASTQHRCPWPGLERWSTVTMRPPRGLNLTNLGGLTCQSNEKAHKQIKMVDLQFVDFPLC